MSNSSSSHRVWLLVAGGAALLVAILFAPVIGVTAIGDGPDGSFTHTHYRSVTNIVTNVWIWLGATAAALGSIAVLAWIAARASVARSQR